jgi:hypothetical protein
MRSLRPSFSTMTARIRPSAPGSSRRTGASVRSVQRPLSLALRTK